MAKVAKQLAENMEDMEIDEEEDEDDDVGLIFTPELAMLKAKEKGEEFVDEKDD